jgi:alpha-1,3-glucan synthase
VGRWSYQKGIDLIADVFPSIIRSNPNVQLICVGPVIDLYGKFAALKLEKLMTQYPGRVFSKPEFTSLPPFIFNGAEFALMPSRDEPFGLVAVEFGRKGALCVGSRVGGFGHMPGWWFTVESITPKHLISQFKSAISAALTSDQETRALMRAYSVVQRFPVAKWVKDLDQLQSSSIHMSMEVRCRRHTWKNISVASGLNRFGMRSSSSLAVESPQAESPQESPPGTPSTLNRSTIASRVTSLFNQSMSPTGSISHGSRVFEPSRLGPGRHFGVNISEPSTPALSIDLPPLSVNAFPLGSPASTPRRLSLETISQEHNDVSLRQNLTPVFSDSKNKYYDQYSEKLDKSKKNTYIEDYIQHSEKDWFQKYHYASLRQQGPSENEAGESARDNPWEEYNQYLGDQYQAPSGAKMLLLRKVGPWYLHWYLLALVSKPRVSPC